VDLAVTGPSVHRLERECEVPHGLVVRSRRPGGVGGTYRPLDGPARLTGAIPVLGYRTSPLVAADRQWFK
jgi:hypothetical protein